MKNTILNKLIVLLLIFVFILSLSACKSKKDKTDSSEINSTVSTNQSSNEESTPSSSESSTLEETSNDSSKTNSVSSQNTSKKKISAVKAKSIAAKDARLTKDDDYGYEAELLEENGIKKYFILLYDGVKEFNYEIDAITGEILYSFNPDVKSSKIKISKNNALHIAINRIGANITDITDYNVELKQEKDVYKYEVTFQAGLANYSYIISAESGKILNSSKKSIE